MGCANLAVKSIFQSRCEQCKKTLRRWSLKRTRRLLDRADEWLHAREVAFRDEAAGNAEFRAEVDPVASAAREKHIQHTWVSGQSWPDFSSQPIKPLKRNPRLKYQHGEFVKL